MVESLSNQFETARSIASQAFSTAKQKISSIDGKTALAVTTAAAAVIGTSLAAYYGYLPTNQPSNSPVTPPQPTRFNFKIFAEPAKDSSWISALASPLLGLIPFAAAAVLPTLFANKDEEVSTAPSKITITKTTSGDKAKELPQNLTTTDGNDSKTSSPPATTELQQSSTVPSPTVSPEPDSEDDLNNLPPLYYEDALEKPLEKITKAKGSLDSFEKFESFLKTRGINLERNVGDLNSNPYVENFEILNHRHHADYLNPFPSEAGFRKFLENLNTQVETTFTTSGTFLETTKPSPHPKLAEDDPEAIMQEFRDLIEQAKRLQKAKSNSSTSLSPKNNTETDGNSGSSSPIASSIRGNAPDTTEAESSESDPFQEQDEDSDSDSENNLPQLVAIKPQPQQKIATDQNRELNGEPTSPPELDRNTSEASHTGSLPGLVMPNGDVVHWQPQNSTDKILTKNPPTLADQVYFASNTPVTSGGTHTEDFILPTGRSKPLEIQPLDRQTLRVTSKAKAAEKGTISMLAEYRPTYQGRHLVFEDLLLTDGYVSFEKILNTPNEFLEIYRSLGSSTNADPQNVKPEVLEIANLGPDELSSLYLLQGENGRKIVLEQGDTITYFDPSSMTTEDISYNLRNLLTSLAPNLILSPDKKLLPRSVLNAITSFEQSTHPLSYFLNARLHPLPPHKSFEEEANEI